MGTDRRQFLTTALLVVGAFLLVPAIVLAGVALQPLRIAASSTSPPPLRWHTHSRGAHAVVARPAGLWPLPTSCFDPVTGGRKPTAKDRAILGDPQAVVVAAYPVRAGRLEAPTDGTAQSCHRLLWNVIRTLYPAKDLALLDRLVVFEGGPNDDLQGEVWPDNASATRWTLAVTLLDQGDVDLAHTLVHELGHLLSLNPSEVDPAPEPATGCDTYDTGGGCSLPGSILDDYTTNTWDETLLHRWFDIDAIKDDKKRAKALADLYSNNETDFVDPYAATDPDEDFAETFAVWCLEEPLLTPPLERKATFMADRPELAPMKARCQLMFD